MRSGASSHCFAYDSIWRSHLPVLENLKRIRRIGVEAWLDEQEVYWADQRRLNRWLRLQTECRAKYQQSGELGICTIEEYAI